MHIPHQTLHQEMLASPQLVRFSFPDQNSDGRYPTLVIKANSLLLKYIVQGVPIGLFFFTIRDGHCGYALHVADDPTGGALIWSLLADEDERLAIKALAVNGGCSVYLFNEACVSCVWGPANIAISGSVLNQLDAPTVRYRDADRYVDEVSAILDGIQSGRTDRVTGIRPQTHKRGFGRGMFLIQWGFDLEASHDPTSF